MKRLFYAVVVVLLGISNSYGQLSRDLTEFQELDVTDKIQVNIIPSNENKIIIEGELANQMELTQVNNGLRLKMTTNYILQGNKVNVTLYSSSVNKISARKGAIVKNDKALQVKSLSLTANEGAEIHAAIQVDQLEGSSMTGARVYVEGTTVAQNVNAGLGGSYFAKDLVSNHTILRVSGGGKAEINAKEVADVQTRAGGIIDVYGSPKVKKDKKIVGGKINYL